MQEPTKDTQRASRTKVAALILHAVVHDGLPYPAQVTFRDDLKTLYVESLSVAEARAWAAFFGIALGSEHDHPTVPGVFIGGSRAFGHPWFGWDVYVKGHDEHRTLGQADDDVADLIAKALGS